MKKNGYLKKISILFLLGIILGVITAIFFKTFYMESYKVYFKDAATQLSDGKIYYGLLYFEALKRILIPCILIFFFSMSVASIPFTILFLLYMGFRIGYYVQSLFLIFHLQGLLYGILSGIPQFLIYAPAILLLFYFTHQMEQAGQKKKGLFEKVLPFGLIFVMLLGGVFLETFINSWIMKQVLFLVQ